VHLISPADGPVTWNEYVDGVHDALEQLERGEVVAGRVGSVPQIEHRYQNVRQHVAGDENPPLVNQQRRMARGMRLMLENPHGRPVPGNLRRPGAQTSDEAEQFQRHPLGDDPVTALSMNSPKREDIVPTLAKIGRFGIARRVVV
jgi:hypothetical protein